MHVCFTFQAYVHCHQKAHNILADLDKPTAETRRSFNDSLNGISDPPLLLERQLLKVTSTSSPTLRLENNIFAPWLMWLKPQQVMEHMMVNEDFLGEMWQVTTHTTKANEMTCSCGSL